MLGGYATSEASVLRRVYGAVTVVNTYLDPAMGVLSRVETVSNSSRDAYRRAARSRQVFK